MRRVLLAVAAVFVAVVLVLLARGLLDETDERGARIEQLAVDSVLTGERRPMTAIVPAGVDEDDERPMLVFLHGRGGSTDDLLSYDELFATLEELGDRAPIVVAPDGGEGSYWHDRADGAWGRYVMEEAIPAALRDLPADRRRVAVGGISMGGFGALDLARLYPGRFCAVGAHSPALWRTGAETAPGAFDHAADFAAHDVVRAAATAPETWAAAPVWVDTGVNDPFVPGTDALLAGLRGSGEVDLTEHRWPGGHEGAYWREHMDEYLRFYARSCD